MAKKSRRALKDPCAPQRARLDDLDAQIQDITEQIGEMDLPPAVRKRLEAKLKQLQQQRQRALSALESCETSHARRMRGK
ncbi:MAG TPA: hypothetical protein VGF53_07170 [Pseudolabrys sp.]|jgi:uncharacterized coiled-coil DUF342 family protein